MDNVASSLRRDEARAQNTTAGQLSRSESATLRAQSALAEAGALLSFAKLIEVLLRVLSLGPGQRLIL